jgi:hypothetical protein
MDYNVSYRCLVDFLGDQLDNELLRRVSSGKKRENGITSDNWRRKRVKRTRRAEGRKVRVRRKRRV